MNMLDDYADVFDLINIFKDKADWLNEDMDYETNDVFDVHGQHIGYDIASFFHQDQVQASNTQYRF